MRPSSTMMLGLTETITGMEPLPWDILTTNVSGSCSIPE
jgi:hypothetical protein